MTDENDRDTPPKQTPNDPNVADRRLSDEQKKSQNNEPAPPQHDKGAPLPDTKEVGEAG
jgi:hypothetical protein